MNNPIYLYDPGYPTAVRRCLGFHEDTLVQAEVPLGWHHGQRGGILIPDLKFWRTHTTEIASQRRPAGRGAKACWVRPITSMNRPVIIPVGRCQEEPAAQRYDHQNNGLIQQELPGA